MSNLNSSVSESDLVDLFCAIGAIRDAKLSADPGSAIITFVKRAAAMAAITKYNGRELDKQKISGNISKNRVCGNLPKYYHKILWLQDMRNLKTPRLYLKLLLIVLWIYHQRNHINGEMNIQQRNHVSVKSLLVKLAILYFPQHWPVLFNQVPNQLFSRSKYENISKLVLCIAFSRSTIRL